MTGAPGRDLTASRQPLLVRVRPRCGLAALLSLGVVLAGCGELPAEESWSRFRGPNGSGVRLQAELPVEFGPDRGVRWQTPLLAGHSSPVLSADRVYLTASDDERLYTYALDRVSGGVVWRRDLARPRREKLHRLNDPASPTPVTDGEAVFVFFGDFGLVAYERDGTERWRIPLGPFENPYGMAASPIVVGDLLIQVCDQKEGSFLLAVDRQSGNVVWRAERPGASTGHSTPIVHRPAGGEVQLLVPGSFRLTAYTLAEGTPVWWVAGLAFEMKATPVLSADESLVYINGTSAAAFEDSYGRAVPGFADLAAHDLDRDGRFSPDEIPDQLARRWLGLVDLDGDGALDAEEWDWYRAARRSRGGMNAFRTGGGGDTTEEAFVWNHDQSVPQLPSALLYRGVVYMVNDGGIVTLLDPETGEVLDRGRIPGAIDDYYASPVAADGKVYLVGASCQVVVLEPARELRTLAVNELDDLCFATPALGRETLFVRTEQRLYAFGGQ